MGEQAGRYVDMGELQRMLDALESPAMREALEEQDPEFALEILSTCSLRMTRVRLAGGAAPGELPR